MKTIFQFPALALSAGLLFCLSLPLLAEPKPAKAEAKTKPAATSDVYVWERKLSEVQFDNIPLGEVVNFLSDQFPEVNFVIQAPVRNIAVSLRLRTVTLEDIITALEITTKNMSAPPVPAMIDPATGLPGASASAPALQITRKDDRLVSFTVADKSEVPVSTALCRAFSLKHFLAGKDDKEVNVAMNEIEQALQTAWVMLRAADQSNAKVQPPQLSLHRATKLLIVVGQPAQVEVVEQVVSQLNFDVTDGERANPSSRRSRGAGTTGGGGVPGFGGFGTGAPTGSPGTPGLSPSPTGSLQSN